MSLGDGNLFRDLLLSPVMKHLLSFFLVLIASVPAFATVADAVYLSGRVLGGKKPLAALAVSGDRILAVGADQEIKKLVGPETKVVDLKGKTVLPGLIDAHVHLFHIGNAKNELDLGAAKDESDALAMIKNKIAQTPKGAWIVGGGWNETLWPSKKQPGLAALDAISPEHPVILFRVDGHAAWVNSLALKAGGISAATPDPSGGKILHDQDGKLSGILLDRATAPISAKIPEPSKAVIEAAVLAALNEAVELGLTSVHDMNVDRATVEVLQELAKNGRLPVRVSVYLSGRDQALVDEWLKSGPKIGAYDGYLSVRGFKLFADGALGSRGAALLKPYDDEPASSGVPIMSQNEIAAFAKKAVRAGFQVATHAIGDKANRIVLDAYESVQKEYPTFAPARHRIEHAQIVHPDDLKRFARLGVIASMQATHCTSDMPWVPARIGRERAEGGAYAWKALLKTGAKIAGGSDAPVESLNPFLGFYAAMTRQDLKGQPPGGWIAKNKMSFEETLRSYTIDAAYASFDETNRGTLEAGKYADFVVLDEKLDQLPPAKLVAVKPVMTVVGGKQISFSAHKER